MYSTDKEPVCSTAFLLPYGRASQWSADPYQLVHVGTEHTLIGSVLMSKSHT